MVLGRYDGYYVTDDADFIGTGEIEAHGDIKVKPGAVLVTPGLSQFGVK